MSSVEREIAVPAEPGVVGVATRGPIAFLRGIVSATPVNTSLKYGLLKSIDDVRDYLSMREELGLEYLFARAIFVGCFDAAPGAHAVFDLLRQKFEGFDRRHQELIITAKEIALTCRDANVQRLTLVISGKKAELLRAFHIAEAYDVDGPWIRNPEKNEIFTLLVKTLTGHVEVERTARGINEAH
jgi:hypothetical protein